MPIQILLLLLLLSCFSSVRLCATPQKAAHHHYLFSWLCYVLVVAFRIFSCGMWDLVPRPGNKPGPPAFGVRSLSHWTTREVPLLFPQPIINKCQNIISGKNILGKMLVKGKGEQESPTSLPRTYRKHSSAAAEKDRNSLNKAGELAYKACLSSHKQISTHTGQDLRSLNSGFKNRKPRDKSTHIWTPYL